MGNQNGYYDFTSFLNGYANEASLVQPLKSSTGHRSPIMLSTNSSLRIENCLLHFVELSAFMSLSSTAEILHAYWSMSIFVVVVKHSRR